MRKLLAILYCALFLIPCVFFSLGVFIPGAVEKNNEAVMPNILKQSPITLNTDFGNEFEEYFQKSFAYRDKVVNIFASLRENLLSEGNEQVIVGDDGFLFFNDTTGDYIGTSVLSDEQILSIATSLENIYNYVKQKGAAFVFAVAPNKNSIYSEKMPERYIFSNERNVDKLYQVLEARGVPYIDLRPHLLNTKDDGLLYFKRDTHWNSDGALIAVNAILDLPQVYEKITKRVDFKLFREDNTDFAGDLDDLLYPDGNGFDVDTYYNLTDQYIFTSAYQTPMDMQISSRSGGEGTLLMFRDSFANSMLPFLCSSFREARFERANPYRVDLLDEYLADVVIIEIAERNINTLIGCDERINKE